MPGHPVVIDVEWTEEDLEGRNKWYRVEKEDLPAVGDTVFLYSSEQKSHGRSGDWCDVGFGKLATVAKVYESEYHKGAYIIEFDKNE